jgi:predicted metalloprotease
MRGIAVLAALTLLCAACGGDSDGTSPPAEAESSDAEVTDLSRQVAQELGFTDEQFDEYESDIALVLGDLRAYWTSVLPQLFGVELMAPSAFIEYHGTEDAPACGGQVVEPGNAFYCAPENYIAWDERNLLLPYFAQVGDFAIAFVLAHEWGHAIQRQVGATAEAGIFFELQADCYAGAWGADADLRGLLEPGDVEEGLRAAESVGDAPGIPWFDPGAHGSPEQRVQAFATGFRDGPFACAELTN